MVECQIRPNRVTSEALIAALRAVPRETFLPRHLQSIAYVDDDIALGGGRFMMDPAVLARLMQEAEITENDVVLDIGCANGYSAAVLGHVAGTVVALESDKTMAEEADKLLREMAVCNVAVIHQEQLTEGYAKQGPYNVIVLAGAVSSIPENITQQLAEGGRLVTVVTGRGVVGEAVIVTRTGEHFSTRKLFDAATPVLSGFEQPKSFVF